MKIIFIIFWTIRQIKSILFWIYLWQLKEYHRKRFIDHFRTAKGKSIFFNWVFGIKILFLILLLFLPSLLLVYLLLLVYILESVKALASFYKKRVKLPVFTAKASAITLVSFLFFFSASIILFLVSPNLVTFIAGLLFLDIFTFLFVSVFVFLFQPITLLFQYRLLSQAKKKREKFRNLIVIGITGSYGKTSTKEILAFILSHKFKVLKTKKHINAEVGIAKTILEELKDQGVFVVEIGAYERGKIRQVCKMVQPKIGVLTGINQQHMATFGSRDNIVRGKFELIEALPEDGVAVLNWDNEFIRQNYRCSLPASVKTSAGEAKFKIIKYSIGNKEDIWAEDIKVEKERISFWISTKEGEREFCEVNLIGGHNIYAILAACAVAKELGMSLVEVVQILRKLKPDYGAMRIKKGVNGIDVVDASYSANPNGVISALDYLKLWEAKRVIVMPCLIELGKASIEVHRKIGEKIAEVCDLVIITTKDRLKEIKQGAISKGMKEENILFIENSKKIFEKIKSFCREGDVVLLEGRVPKRLKELLLKEKASP